MRERSLLVIFCLVVTLMALGTVGWTVVSGQIRYLDGLLLVLFCMVVITIFFPIFFFGVRKDGLRGLLGSRSSKERG
jgi:hypothetical protein